MAFDARAQTRPLVASNSGIVNDTLALVRSLSATDPTALRALLRERQGSTAGVRDWFDLADALLTPASLDDALTHLPRPVLLELIAGTLDTASLELLTQRALAVDGAALDALAARVAALTPMSASTEPVDRATPLSGQLDRAAREHALLLTTRLDELLELVEATGLQAVSRGGISSSDASRVEAVLGELPGTLNELVSLLTHADLVEQRGTRWQATNLTDWRAADSAERWLLLARSWRSQLRDDLARTLSQRDNWGESLGEYLTWLFPLDDTWASEQLAPLLAQAKLLGLSVTDMRTSIALPLLTGDDDAALAAMRTLLPAYIDSVLLQSDLTVVAPGPLRPEVEQHLRRYAAVESRSVASTYRLTPGLISRAMDEGDKVSDIEAFLTEISSTGLPQPVAYLINDIGKKHATVRVRVAVQGSRITCSDETTASSILADSSLGVLSLTRLDSTTLSSPVDASVVVRNLLAEKYPAALENETGEIQRLVVGAARTTSAASAPKGDPLEELIARLVAHPASTEPSDAQWINRQIDVAIRNKATLAITVVMPDGSEKEFTIDPRAISNGRLRAHDRRSQVERTIPITSIINLQPAL